MQATDLYDRLSKSKSKGNYKRIEEYRYCIAVLKEEPHVLSESFIDHYLKAIVREEDKIQKKQ